MIKFLKSLCPLLNILNSMIIDEKYIKAIVNQTNQSLQALLQSLHLINLVIG